ncbi:hypothetical protein WG926_11660 [Tistrella sp. BH-R2-4]|uniref:Uncharacterized protein n=1 Tax=Tistrella arctica TaxID=3133430 RepID=A0ABU9YJK2_9PROT
MTHGDHERPRGADLHDLSVMATRMADRLEAAADAGQRDDGLADLCRQGAMLSGLWRIARQLLREARRLSDEEPDPTPGPEALRAATDQWMRAHGYVRIAAPGDFICNPRDLTLTLRTSPRRAGWCGAGCHGVGWQGERADAAAVMAWLARMPVDTDAVADAADAAPAGSGPVRRP